MSLRGSACAHPGRRGGGGVRNWGILLHGTHGFLFASACYFAQSSTFPDCPVPNLPAMKHFPFVALVALACANLQAQDVAPPQLLTLRSRYETAVKGAVEPLRLRYVEELQRTRDSAMSQKKLDVANVIDTEIAAVTPGSSASASSDDKLPSALRTQRTRYLAAVKAATEPLKRTYTGELKSMMTGAMAQKNLDLANAVDAELKALASEPEAGSGRLASALTGTTWSWGVTAATAGSTLRFLENRSFRVNNDSIGRYTVVSGTTVKLDNGAVLTFSRDLRSYEGTTSNGETRAGRKK